MQSPHPELKNVGKRLVIQVGQSRCVYLERCSSSHYILSKFALKRKVLCPTSGPKNGAQALGT
jgi:hypothetical protein